MLKIRILFVLAIIIVLSFCENTTTAQEVTTKLTRCCQLYDETNVRCLACPYGAIPIGNQCYLYIDRCVKYTGCYSCEECSPEYKLVDTEFNGLSVKKCQTRIYEQKNVEVSIEVKDSQAQESKAQPIQNNENKASNSSTEKSSAENKQTKVQNNKTEEQIKDINKDNITEAVKPQQLTQNNTDHPKQQYTGLKKQQDVNPVATQVKAEKASTEPVKESKKSSTEPTKEAENKKTDAIKQAQVPVLPKILEVNQLKSQPAPIVNKQQNEKLASKNENQNIKKQSV